MPRTSLWLVPAAVGLALGAMFAWGDSSASGAGTDAVAGGLGHSCALRGGAVSCWGLNASGQLGNNDPLNADSSVPVAVFGLSSGVTAIATGDNHSCAIQAGAAYCWGSNSAGQLGNNDATHTPSNIPVAVAGLGSGVTSISAGGTHTCAVQSGAAVCWGSNAYGQLGKGGGADSDIPVPVTGLGILIGAVTAGQNFACALQSGGLWCWGQNANGQLGDTTIFERTSPVAVSGLGSGSGVTAVAAGYNHTCAIQAGAALCWGKNASGQVGNNDPLNADSSIPAAVTGLSSGVTRIDGGGAHSCAIVLTGAFCWGRDVEGQLGNSLWSDSNVPVAVTGLSSNVTAITAGGFHSCAVQDGGAVCWGKDTTGQLGDGGTSNSNFPIAVSGAVGATDTPTPTDTPVATDTPTATDTPVATSTNTPGPTATDTPAPTATDTAVPGATNTPAPTATDTAIPATATNTSVSGTATSTSVPGATNTAAPGGGSVRAATATATNTPPATAIPPTDTPAAAPPPQSVIEPPSTGPGPNGGAAGQGVQAPDTGTGDATEQGSIVWWIVVAGMTLAAAGGATMIAGARRR